jgi:hypothetical protein
VFDDAQDMGTAQETIWVIELRFLFPAGRAEDATIPRRFIDIARSVYPQVLPRRYGEGLRSRFRVESTEEFVAAWTSPHGVWWTATTPCFEGGFSQPWAHAAPPTERFCFLHLTLDGRASNEDQSSTERAVDLFRRTAADLAPFFAEGFVRRDLVLPQGQLLTPATTFYDHPDWEVTFIGRYWRGIPPAPRWLSWFGPPYATLVRSALPPNLILEEAGGILLRIGAQPLHLDELRPIFPSLPATLLARPYPVPPPTHPDHLRRRVFLQRNPQIEAAEHIPPLR